MFKKSKEIKKELFPKVEMIIDFDGIVSTPEEITNVLINYCNNENKDLVILKKGMTPIVKIDGKIYIVRTDRFAEIIYGRRKLNSSYPLPYFGRASIDQKLYLYPYDYIEE